MIGQEESSKQFNKLKAERKLLRRCFTVSHNKFVQYLENKSLHDLEREFAVLKDKANRLFDIDARINEYLFELVQDEVELNKECDTMESYRELFAIASNDRDKLMVKELDNSFADACNSKANPLHANKSKYKLPKLQLNKFSGTIQGWISFWAQFRKIHEDCSLDEEDKFQYLLLSTSENSPARELIESFPPSAQNYNKAIEQLKIRFGRDELLIEYYVRQLLKLVLARTSEQKGMPLRSLYDKLESQLRALESLGVTSEKYACMLLPLVESALPETTLKEWERRRSACIQVSESSEGEKLEAPKLMTNLLNFLRKEVESEERLQLVANSFFTKSDDFKKNNFDKAERRKSNDYTPTAAGLVNTREEIKNKPCVFCDGLKHANENCFKARSLSQTELNKIVKNSGCCYVCLRKGHTAQQCKANVSCIICGKRHRELLCPERTVKNIEKKESHLNKNTETMLTNSNRQTLLQTLFILLVGERKSLRVRCLLDSASQRSYIKKDVAKYLGLKPVDHENMRHGLFGGAKTDVVKHSVFQVIIRKLDGSFENSIKLLDQEKICDFVPHLADVECFEKLKKLDIHLTDFNCEESEIGVLIGADVLPSIMTSNLKCINKNTVAVETKLGWTLLGDTKGEQTCAMVSLSNIDELDITESSWQASEEDVDKERRKMAITVQTSTVQSTFTEQLNYFSKYSKQVRMVGWMLRFSHNAKKKNRKICIRGELTGEEYMEAEKKLIYCVQKERFGADKKNLRNMHIFEDEDGLLRVKTKLIYANDTESFRCPIILPSDSVITKRLIYYKHLQAKHVGVQGLLSILREDYWLLKGRKTVKMVLSSCVICQRHRAKPVKPPFAPLPADRIREANVFENTGMDLAGPLILRSGKKVWVLLCTCAVYRAVHLELVRSLSTENFLMAFRRFLARRGRVSIVYTDNGTNFVGAANCLSELNWNVIIRETGTKRIRWKFNPPTAAWWGGWWERLIGVLKSLLKRTLGTARLDNDELYTLLCECEAIMNDRPLTYISEDEYFVPLSPSSFLRSIVTYDVADLDEVDAQNLRRRCRYVQTVRKNLRERFRKEYLSLLIHRGRHKSVNLEVGEIVLLGVENVKRMFWPLAKIIEVQKGQDGNCRMVKVKTATGEFIRPVQRLYPLEISMDLVRELPEAKAKKQTIFKKPSAVKPQLQSTDPSSSRPKRNIKIPQRLDL